MEKSILEIKVKHKIVNLRQTDQKSTPNKSTP